MCHIPTATQCQGPDQSPCPALGGSGILHMVNLFTESCSQRRLQSHLAEGEHTLLCAHDAAFQHEEVVVDLPVVRKATLWREAERKLAGRKAGWEQMCPQVAREEEGSD